MLKRAVTHRLSLALLTASVIGLSAHAAADGDVRVLKFTHAWPATHFIWTEGAGYFGDLVKTATNGKVVLEQYPAAQLGKESVTLIGSGLVDGGIIAPTYEPAKLPLSTVGELPGLHASACEGTAKMWSLVKEGGALYNAELKPMGLRALYANVLGPYQIVTTKKEVTRLEDLGGLKIAAGGAAMDKTTRALGAIPMQIAGSEFYDALARGSSDGGLWNVQTLRQWGVDGVVKYTVKGPRLGAALTIHVINEKVWQSFDAATQRILTDAAMKTQQHLCSYADDQLKKETDIMVAAGSLKVDTLSGSEVARWNAAVAPIAGAWVNQLASTGRPAAQVLKDFIDAPATF